MGSCPCKRRDAEIARFRPNPSGSGLWEIVNTFLRRLSPLSTAALALIASRRLVPGLALSAALASAGIALGRINWLAEHGFSALMLAIVLGMLVGNTVYPRFAAASGPGVNLPMQNLLRLGIIL